jgi:hypothetical protein
MAQASRSVKRSRFSKTSNVGGAVGRGITRVLEGVGFWSAVVFPFVAVALVAVRPSGWVPLSLEGS